MVIPTILIAAAHHSLDNSIQTHTHKKKKKKSRNKKKKKAAMRELPTFQQRLENGGTLLQI